MPRTTLRVALLLSTAFAAVAACTSDPAAPSTPIATPSVPLSGATEALPVEVSPPSVYVAKVKNILVGLPPTDAEVKAVEADPTQLATLIDGWMQLPQYETKMLRFFELAFEQTQVTDIDFDDQSFPRQMSLNGATRGLIVENATESFARTIYSLVSQGHPLTEAMTTRSFMMTPALMELYGFLDAWQVDDTGKVSDRLHAQEPEMVITVGSAPVALADSVNPASPNFMHWPNASLAKYELLQPGCFGDPVVYPATRVDQAYLLHGILQGFLESHPNATVGGKACTQVATATDGVLAPADYTTWKMVSTRAPAAGENPTAFYDLPALRASSELVLKIPRVGFFSTPAFFANWHTNTSNQMRVTMNQALIVALGAMVDGTDATHPASTPGLDAAHASAPACFACHQTLDPTRSIFASTFSWNYHNQAETAFSSQPGMFAFQGVTQTVGSIDDFGSVLAKHPLFAQAWAQKLCNYANSRPCDAEDPEFQRVVNVFKASNFSWNAVVREVLASPITTNAKATKTLADEGEVIAISRRDHLCAALDVRLGFSDICGLKTAQTGKAKAVATIDEIVSGLPSDGYGRGSIAPVLPNAPNLFYRAGTENICEAVAQLVVDPPTPTAGATQWPSSAPDVAISAFVQTIMGLTPSDPRSQPSIAALHGHFTAALATGATASDALRSTFVVACLAPSSISIGL